MISLCTLVKVINNNESGEAFIGSVSKYLVNSDRRYEEGPQHVLSVTVTYSSRAVLQRKATLGISCADPI